MTTSTIDDQRVVVGVDDHVDAVAEDVEVGVGHQRRNLDEPVGLQVQPGHLTVDPHQFVAHSAHSKPTPVKGRTTPTTAVYAQ